MGKAYFNSDTARTVENTKEIFDFVPVFMKRYMKTEATLSYPINVIDELHADENAHSRILARLLQQRTPCGRFEILESFVRYISAKSASFGSIRIDTPDITRETERIDLWIRDKEFAIIVENKIHRAGDQPEQLSRYIDSTKAKRYVEEQIFVVYLSPTCDKMPDEQTWGVYRDKFAERFVNLSFRDDILAWLIDAVLPNVRLKDKYLSSAVVQYIDHLEGMFDLRNINQKMNMELQDFIKQEWGLAGSAHEKMSKLLVKQKEIDKITNQIELLKKDFEAEIFQEWKISLKTKYPDYPQITKNDVAGLTIQVQNTTVKVASSFDESHQRYCQVDVDDITDEKERILPQEVIEKVGHLLPKKNNSQIWRILPRHAVEETEQLLFEVVRILAG